MIVRWMGAFNKKASLGKALVWELTQTEKKALAAENLKKCGSSINHALVGLLVPQSAVLRKFRSDVWSEYRNGTLVKTRREGDAKSQHAECWVKPHFVGIVLKSPHRISPHVLKTCEVIARKYGLPIYVLTRDGRLISNMI